MNFLSTAKYNEHCNEKLKIKIFSTINILSKYDKS